MFSGGLRPPETPLGRNPSKISNVAQVKRWIPWLVILMGTAVWAVPPSLDHVILVDVSGSMRNRGYADRQAWAPDLPDFLKALVQPGGKFFPESSQFTLRPFSDVATDDKESRVALGPGPLADFASRWEEVAPPGGGATDMARALDLAQLMLQASSHPGVIWLITDNENNFSTNQSDKAFYERLRDSPDYNYVYLFPLADPAKRANDCLVMYLLVPPRVLESEEVADLAKEVERKTGFQGMLFRPLYNETNSTTLDFSKELTFDGPGKHKLEQEGGQTVLFFQEGEKLQGNLRFRIRSRLKGWKVQGASLEDAEVQLQVPTLYEGGSTSKLQWKVTPKTLEVSPEQDSMTFFNLQISGPGGKPILLQRRASQMLTHPFTSWLPDVQGEVKMKAILHLDQGNLTHEVPPEMQQRLSAVPRLAEVEQYMVQQQDLSQNQGNQRDILFQRKLVVRVKADPTSAIVAAILLVIGGVAAVACAVAVLLWKVQLRLEGPGIEEEFTLSALFGQYLICDGKGMPHCRVHCNLGSLTLKAEPDFVFENEVKQLSVRWEGDEFRFEVGPEGKPLDVFWLRRKRTGGSSGGLTGGDGPL